MIYILYIILALLFSSFSIYSWWLLVILSGVWTRLSWSTMLIISFAVGLFDSIANIHPLGWSSLIFISTVLVLRVGYERLAEQLAWVYLLTGLISQITYWIVFNTYFSFSNILIWTAILVITRFIFTFFAKGEGIYLKS